MCDLNFHPEERLLLEFAQGNLDTALAVMVSAHLELCSICQTRLAQIEDELAELAFCQPQPCSIAAPMEEDASLNGLFSQLLTQVDSVIEHEEPSSPPAKGLLKLGQQQFKLPRALARHQQEIGPWSRLPGRVQIAHVDISGPFKMNFVYMDDDSALPQHTHQGQEITLVLSGEFYDEQACYRSGDFVLQNTQHQHIPRTKPGQQCLCLTLLDAPLRFTSGLATLLNPFSQLFFR